MCKILQKTALKVCNKPKRASSNGDLQGERTASASGCTSTPSHRAGHTPESSLIGHKIFLNKTVHKTDLLTSAQTSSPTKFAYNINEASQDGHFLPELISFYMHNSEKPRDTSRTRM